MMMRLGNWAMRSAASLDLTTFPRHDDAERTRTHAIVEWRIHHLHFAIERHRQPACLGANLQLLQAEAFDVARLANLAENHAADHPEEAERTALLDHIDRDLAAIEVVTPHELKELHAVFVIADKQAWRVVGARPAFRREREPAARKMLQHAEQRRHHRHPFGELVTGSSA